MHIVTKKNDEGTVACLYASEAPTSLVKLLHQSYTGLHRFTSLITHYTPYFHREAHETLPKGGMTLWPPGYWAPYSHTTL